MKENFFSSKTFILGLLIVFILLFVAAGREAYRSYGIGQEIKDLQGKIEELNKSNLELAEMEKYLQSDEFLEKEARLKLNVVREGEKLVIIKQPEGEIVTEEKQIAEERETSNIQKWWRYFFKKR
jgi:cell division protein FtsB